MHRQGLAFVVAVVGASLARAGQQDVLPVAFQDDAYYRQGDEFLTSGPHMPLASRRSSSDSALAVPSTSCEPECGAADACCDDGCCGDACCGADCGSGCGGGLAGFTLAGLIGIADPWHIGGWTEGVYMDNNVPLSQAYNDLLSFDDVPDHFHLGQQWFYIGRTVDGVANGFDLGGRIDTVYGTDAQKTQAFGNPNAGVRGFGTWDASLDHGEYGWAIPQAYGEIAAGAASVKIGHFFTPVGYEVIPVTGNFFRSHSYTMYNSEPFTHTGVLGTYAMDAVTLYGGWTLGWDTGFDQLNQGNMALSGFAVNLGESVTFTYINCFGNFGWRDGGADNSLMHSAVLVASLTDNLQYIAQVDNIDTSNPGVSEYDTIGLNQYLLYSLNDIVGVGGRIEWWKADGVSFYEATSGLNLKLLDNVNIRPEYRQDWAPGIGLDEDTFLVDAYVTY
jgi:hypothetical protein